jgi:hypothetical protein
LKKGKMTDIAGEFNVLLSLRGFRLY